jgi:hypothetical protein
VRRWSFELPPAFFSCFVRLKLSDHGCFSQGIELTCDQQFATRMKISDDYNAKYRLWAANPTVVPAPPAVRLPNFKSKRFSSHAELNVWKLSVLRQLAQLPPAK